MSDYELIDSGNGEKLERFGPHRLIRPCAQAVWAPDTPRAWDGAVRFTREGSGWSARLPPEWKISYDGIQFRLAPTPFGHLGLFPEHRAVWSWARDQKPKSVLNLFAYSGGLTLATAQLGAEVCHIDASKGMVEWARKKAALNGLDAAPIRWIVDDVTRFLTREAKRGRHYDGIVLDPPTYGRGKRGEVFKIERDLPALLKACRQLEPRFLAVSCHTPGFSPLVLRYLVEQAGFNGSIDGGELLLEGSRPIPCGVLARWKS